MTGGTGSGPSSASPKDMTRTTQAPWIVKRLPAYPRHSACEAVCSQYVPYEGVTVMRFKVASRVRGLSDGAFREAFGTEEQCHAALLRLRWPDGFLCPCCGHRGHCVLAGRGAISMQPVQEADIAHGGHDLPRDQAAADTLVCSHPPDRDGEERHLVGGTRRPPMPCNRRLVHSLLPFMNRSRNGLEMDPESPSLQAHFRIGKYEAYTPEEIYGDDE